MPTAKGQNFGRGLCWFLNLDWHCRCDRLYPGNNVWEVGIAAQLPHIDNPVQKVRLRYVTSFISISRLNVGISQRRNLIVNADHQTIFLIMLLMISIAKMTTGQDKCPNCRVPHLVFRSESVFSIWWQIMAIEKYGDEQKREEQDRGYNRDLCILVSIALVPGLCHLRAILTASGRLIWNQRWQDEISERDG